MATTRLEDTSDSEPVLADRGQAVEDEARRIFAEMTNAHRAFWWTADRERRADAPAPAPARALTSRSGSANEHAKRKGEVEAAASR